MHPRNTKKQRSFLKPSLFIPLLLVVLLGTLFVLEKTKTTDFIKLHPSKAATTSGPTKAQQTEASQVDSNNKKTFIESSPSSTSSTSGSSTSSPSSTTNPAKSIDVSAKQETNSTVTIFTKLFGYSSGSCALKVTNGAYSNQQTANVIYQSEFSTCAGFSVPIQGLGSGVWSIHLTVTADGNTAAKDIQFEVK